MKKLMIVFTLIVALCTMTYAAEKYDTRAFRMITKLCTACHGTPFYMAKQSDEDDWDFYFNTPGKLEKLHKNKPQALASLKNKLFKTHKKRLLKFFIHNSKYSGSVHGCDANFCGTHH